MKTKTKTIIIISSILVLGGGAYFLISSANKRKRLMAEFQAQMKELKNMSDAELKALEEEMKSKSEAEQEALKEELLTEIDNVRVGKFAYPTGEDVNIRSQAKVNDGWLNNRIGKVTAPNRIGMIDKVVSSMEYGDKNKWYKIKLDKSLGGRYLGYAREDVVTVKNK